MTELEKQTRTLLTALTLYIIGFEPYFLHFNTPRSLIFFLGKIIGLLEDSEYKNEVLIRLAEVVNTLPSDNSRGDESMESDLTNLIVTDLTRIMAAGGVWATELSNAVADFNISLLESLESPNYNQALILEMFKVQKNAGTI